MSVFTCPGCSGPKVPVAVKNAATPHASRMAIKIGKSWKMRCVPRRYWEKSTMRKIVRPPMPQCLPATGAPNLNSARPMRAMVGAMVTGPTKRNRRPTRPL